MIIASGMTDGQDARAVAAGEIAWETPLTPETYAVVGALKRAQGVDVFDRAIDFVPFGVKV